MPSSVFRSAIAVAVLVCMAVSTTFADSQRPNILMILVDDLGFADLSSYGSTDLQTPHVDALVKDGMRFENFYANCPVCSPTRAALLTGRYQDYVGVPGVVRTHAVNSWGFLDPAAVTLPDVLNDAGYHTAIIGKWHLGLKSPNTPNERGIDFFHGFRGDMMDDYYHHRRHGINYMYKNQTEIDPKGHATDLFSDWASDYLKTRKNNKQPFFLYLAYNAPHTPIQPPKEWFEKVKQREAGITNQRARLVALIEHMDHGIGQVIKTLKDTKQYDNTLIVFTSDNGGQANVGANNAPWRGEKQEVYEGGLRVPACAVWKGKIQPGTSSDLRAITMDLYPTFCDAAGATFDHAIEGRSILPTLLGKQQSFERDLFFTRREGGSRYMGLTIQAVIRGDWKLLQNSPFQPFELYNLKDDPQETKDLAKQDRRKFNELAAAMRLHLQLGGQIPWQRPANAQRLSD